MTKSTEEVCNESVLAELLSSSNTDTPDEDGTRQERCLRRVFVAFCQQRTNCVSSLLEEADMGSTLCSQVASSCVKVDSNTNTILLWAVVCLGILLFFILAAALFRRLDFRSKQHVAQQDSVGDLYPPDGSSQLQDDNAQDDWLATSLVSGSIGDDLGVAITLREVNLCDSTLFDDTPEPGESLGSVGSDEGSFWTGRCEV